MSDQRTMNTTGDKAELAYGNGVRAALGGANPTMLGASPVIA